IALNLLLNGLIIATAIVFFPLGNERAEIGVRLLSIGSVFLVYACITQLVLLMKTQKRSIFAMIILSSLMFVPTVAGNILQLPDVITFTFFPLSAFLINSSAFGFSLLVQWVAIIGSSVQLTRQLKQAGESNSKALFADNNLKGSVLG
ncbi:MAG: hypothetical protein RI580_06060, partial [Halothece sp. Uz-M2-17]|nr:hypothetical protein [Halothece sp. Uz-M2-17]